MDMNFRFVWISKVESGGLRSLALLPVFILKRHDVCECFGREMVVSYLLFKIIIRLERKLLVVKIGPVFRLIDQAQPIA